MNTGSSRPALTLRSIVRCLLIGGFCLAGFAARAQEEHIRPAAEVPHSDVIAEVAEKPTVKTSKKKHLTLARLAPHATPRGDKNYFIEFRARSALSYGHTFAAFGRLNAQGQIESFEVAGLHPAGESSVPWSIGHVIAVPSETGPSDGDLEEEYITARFRVDLNEEQYRKVVAYIRKLQNNSPLWHAVLYNCSAFVSDIGRFMGLRAPNPLLFPADFINTMREMNTDKASAQQSEFLDSPK